MLEYHATHRFNIWKEVMIFLTKSMSLKANQQEIIVILWLSRRFLTNLIIPRVVPPFPVIGKWRFRLESTTKNVKVQVRWLLYTGKRPTQVISQRSPLFWPHFAMGISLVHALFQLAAPPKQQVIGDCGNHPQRFLVSEGTAEGSKSPPKRWIFEGILKKGICFVFFPTQIFRTMKHNLKTLLPIIFPPKFIQVGLLALQKNNFPVLLACKKTLCISKKFMYPARASPVEGPLYLPSDPGDTTTAPSFHEKKILFWKFRMNP